MIAYTGASVYDGEKLYQNHAVLVTEGRFQGICGSDSLPAQAEAHPLSGGVISPGLVDLQVNGGGGVMFNDNQSLDALRQIANAHAALGSTSILPTLITDTPQVTRLAINTAIKAIQNQVPGIAGLHLEGPHLDVARKGAHDASLIRPMTSDDLGLLIDAAAKLPVLKVTVAPQSVSAEQVKMMTRAGIVVSLGHTEATCQQAADLVDAGATCVTHLFNAMSQMTARQPGLVGSALAEGQLYCGLIADGVHVDFDNIGIACRAKAGPGQLFLVSDAMATAGSAIQSFELNGRTISRALVATAVGESGCLTLADGTLAGADLDLVSAIRNMIRHAGCNIEQALAMATSIPARLISQQQSIGHISNGASADFIHLDENWNLAGVWRAGNPVEKQE